MKLEALGTRPDTLISAAGADQSLVDSLFGCPITRPQRPVLPKGLGERIGWVVPDAVRAAGELCAAECSDQVGISRVKARRFLEHYLRTGELELRLQYGAGGRNSTGQ